jgi:hypothetical protein
LKVCAAIPWTIKGHNSLADFNPYRQRSPSEYHAEDTTMNILGVAPNTVVCTGKRPESQRRWYEYFRALTEGDSLSSQSISTTSQRYAPKLCLDSIANRITKA